MGVKSRTKAEKRKEIKKNVASAKLRNVPTSPRKMRLVADLVRGKRVEIALHILKTNPKHPAIRLHKLLLSAIANWQNKNNGLRLEESDLFVKEIKVDVGRTLKRIQPSPQGRAHRIRKRSNHVSIVLDSMNKAVLEKETSAAVDTVSEVIKPGKKPKAETKPAVVKKAKPEKKPAKTAVKSDAKPKVKTDKPTKAGTKAKSEKKITKSNTED